MKKLSYSFVFWSMALFNLFFSFHLFGQTSTSPSLVIMDEDDGKNGEGANLNPDGTTSLRFRVTVANLAPLEFVNEHIEYSLPTNYPHIGFSYSVGNNADFVLVDKFKFAGEVNGYPIFDAVIRIPLDFSNECNTGPGDGGNHSFYVTGNYRLVRGDEDIAYPVIPYSSPNDIFSCEVFDETCGHCYPGICEGIDEASFSINHHFTCVGVDDKGEETPPSLGFSSSVYSGVLTFPNPSSHSVQLKFNAKESSNGNIQLFDQTGKVIAQQNISIVSGLNIEEIDLSTLNNGIYFGQLWIGKQAQSFKVVKLK